MTLLGANDCILKFEKQTTVCWPLCEYCKGMQSRTDGGFSAQSQALFGVICEIRKSILEAKLGRRPPTP